MTQPPPSDQVRTIDRDDLWAKIGRGDRFRLVMALNEWAFRAKHIPGSEHFNTPEELFTSLNPADEIVVYCTSPECHSSIALYQPGMPFEHRPLLGSSRGRLRQREAVFGGIDRLGRRRSAPGRGVGLR